MDKTTRVGVPDLHVVVRASKFISSRDLGIAVTDEAGKFEVSFDSADSGNRFFKKRPDLHFAVSDGGEELLDTKDQPIKKADESAPEVRLFVDLSADRLRRLIQTNPAPGWVGGFERSDPAFAYPSPDLSSLPMLDNLANIDRLERQQKVVWPEFSWRSRPGEDDPQRCFLMFAPDISRLGYTREGRVFSIICPQAGVFSPSLGSINTETTVTGNRGWVNEADKTIAAEMSVEAKIWFGPSAHKHSLVKGIADHFRRRNHPFPLGKATAIRVSAFKPGNPDEPIFPLIAGQSADFETPDFANHDEVAWSVGHLNAEIGDVVPTGVARVDDFNRMIVDVVNMISGNILKVGNVLTWNVWFTAPEAVDQVEWADHAERWRHSLEVDHAGPEGNGSKIRYFDGSEFKVTKSLVEEEERRLGAFFRKHMEAKR